MLEALKERIREATGPDRQLDYALFCHFAPRDVASAWHPHDGHKYTASVDDALALVERLLPGWNYTFNRGHCELRHPKHRAKDVQAFGKTTPLAILAALLTALKDASE